MTEPGKYWFRQEVIGLNQVDVGLDQEDFGVDQEVLTSNYSWHVSFTISRANLTLSKEKFYTARSAGQKGCVNM